ncbi:hypothetical protein [Duganella sp. Root1480D1]|uniref:hypothetical protein n=1 Tax=Duganella sp. Root1480D1 TaxID=1736471 RepID=UPI000AF769F3|nr:hypothetical protein [Duganella sp. Root1480D1]
MQMIVKERLLEFRDYLGLNTQTLEPQRLAGEVQVLWARISPAKMRIAMLLAPVGMAWGMQYRLRQRADEVVDALLGDEQLAQTLRGSIEEMGYLPERLPKSLLQCEVFWGREDGMELALGAEADDVPHASFRAILLPDDDIEFSSFFDRLRAYIAQLGKFFLLPIPPGVDFQRWQYEEDVRLSELLSGRPGGLKRGQGTQGWQGAIRLAVQSLEASEAETWLTPAFLEYEQVKTNYPIPENVRPTWRALVFLALLKFMPIGEQLEHRKAVTMLKLQLIRKWLWPLGLRQLQNGQQASSFRKTMLAGGEPCAEAEALVAEILTEGRRRYPVLFE